MCGIAGYSTASPERKHVLQLQRLLDESRVRGLHAFGLAWLDASGALRALRTNDLTEAQLQLDELQEEPPKWVLAHTRYSTSGDYRVPENNQPIALGDLALTFNGVYHMGTKAQMEEELGESMLSDNDGEMLLRLYARGENLPALLASRGSFAGALYDGTEQRLRLLRNTQRPLWLAHADGCRFWTSTQDIMKRAGLVAEVAAELPAGMWIEVTP